MDADLVTGTRSDAQAVEFMQRRAIPKQLHRAKPSDLVKFPTSTVQQVIQRQRAEEAAQKGFPPWLARPGCYCGAYCFDEPPRARCRTSQGGHQAQRVAPVLQPHQRWRAAS